MDDVVGFFLQPDAVCNSSAGILCSQPSRQAFAIYRVRLDPLFGGNEAFAQKEMTAIPIYLVLMSSYLGPQDEWWLRAWSE